VTPDLSALGGVRAQVYTTIRATARALEASETGFCGQKMRAATRACDGVDNPPRLVAKAFAALAAD
jgi:hypothetical protein